MKKPTTTLASLKGKILETISTERSKIGYSGFEFLQPLKKLYISLDDKERLHFRNTVLKMLEGNEDLEAVIDICEFFKFRECCPQLLCLISNPPDTSMVDSFHVPKEHIQRNAIVAVERLRCKQAVPILDSLLLKEQRKKVAKDAITPPLAFPLLVSLAKLSPEKTSIYLGWCINLAKTVDQRTAEFVKTLDDWKRMEEMKIAPNLDFPTSGTGAGSIRLCLFSIAKKRGLKGLKAWLKSVILLNEDDRNYLKIQLSYMLAGEDSFTNLKNLIKDKENPQSLGQELASLPSV